MMTPCVLGQIPSVQYDDSGAEIFFNGQSVRTKPLAGEILEALVDAHRSNPNKYYDDHWIAHQASTRNKRIRAATAVTYRLELRAALRTLGICHWLQTENRVGHRWFPHHLPGTES